MTFVFLCLHLIIGKGDLNGRFRSRNNCFVIRLSDFQLDLAVSARNIRPDEGAVKLRSKGVSLVCLNARQHIGTIFCLRYSCAVISSPTLKVKDVARTIGVNFALYLGGVQGSGTVYSDSYGFGQLASSSAFVLIHHIRYLNGGSRGILVNSFKGNLISTICYFVDAVVSEGSLIAECLAAIGGKLPLV